MKIYDDKSRAASERNIWIKRGYAMADLSSIQFSFRYTNNSADDQRERFYEAAETVRYQENLDRSRIMERVMAAIAEKFVCYQYTKEDPAPYGSDRWDLFFWCNSFPHYGCAESVPDRDYSYFTLTFNEKQTAEQHWILRDRLERFLRENFEHNKNLDVVFQHKVAYNIQKIREDAGNLKRCLDRKRCEYQGQEGVLVWRDGRLLFKKKYAKTKAYVVNDLAVLEYGYQFGLLSDADARPFQHRISGPLVYERDGIRVELNDKGESLFSGYDTNSPHMPSGYWPTFEFYVDVLSEGGWRELTGIGSRTQLPVGLPQETLERALQHIHKECLAVLKADSSVSLKEIGERISKITLEMFAQSRARE